MKNSFTSESVTCGHPDKVCDQIADAILDEMLKQDPDTRSACEVTCSKNMVHIFGEVTTSADIDYEEIARETIAKVGYTRPGHGFDAESCKVTVDLHKQSPDIARGIHRRGEVADMNCGAGDQGIMFGYACQETDSFMPLALELSHDLAKRLEKVRRTDELPYLLPDGKTQVTIEHSKNGEARISTVVVSTQHMIDVNLLSLRQDIYKHIILPVLPMNLVDSETQYFINPTGRFVEGGPAADSGLTGRKIIVDTYGGSARHGGGSFSGKDATKMDRSGAYMARYMAKNIVAAGMAKRCEVQLGYAIGLSDPVSLLINTFGTGTISDDAMANIMSGMLDLRPMGIINRFHLKEPIYSQVSCYGHFGRNAAKMPWEQTDLVDKLPNRHNG